jgi:hypothetical protein
MIHVIRCRKCGIWLRDSKSPNNNAICDECKAKEKWEEYRTNERKKELEKEIDRIVKDHTPKRR